MRALVITDRTRQRAKEIKDYAESHVISSEDLVHMTAGRLKSPGDNPKFVMHIDFGYRVVYSQEIQPEQGRCHHLSVSLDKKGRYPVPEAVSAIMEMFGLGKPDFSQLDDDNALVAGGILLVWSDENSQSVNVLMKV